MVHIIEEILKIKIFLLFLSKDIFCLKFLRHEKLRLFFHSLIVNQIYFCFAEALNLKLPFNLLTSLEWRSLCINDLLVGQNN